MVEGLLRHRLEAAAVSGVTVSSAGSLPAGHPATAEAVQVMAARGIDITDHESRLVTADLLEAADLVLAMTRGHVRDACVEVPAVFDRTFTLKELVRRGRAVGPRGADESFDDWLAELSRERRPEQFLGDSPDDDVADPVGLPYRVYKRTAKELDALVDDLARLVWPA
jgi:protein-tyrosine phosphatase